MAQWLFLAIYPLERSCLPLMSAAKVEHLLVEKITDQIKIFGQQMKLIGQNMIS